MTSGTPTHTNGWRRVPVRSGPAEYAGSMHGWTGRPRCRHAADDREAVAGRSYDCGVMQHCHGCPQCLPESLSERIGMAVAARVLSDPELERVCPRIEAANQGDQPQSPDYRSARSAVEVKELKSAGLAELQNALGQQRFYRAPQLQSTWNVWPEHDWSNSPSGDHVIRPRQLVKKLIPLIAELEAAGHTSHGPRDPIWATFQIRALLGGGRCSALSASLTERYGPGVLLGHLITGERSGYLDDALVTPIQDWIDNDRLATNMTKSLHGESPRKRCGVLVLGEEVMQPAPAHLRSSLADFPGETPTRALTLPEGVDVFVVSAGDEYLAYDNVTGWARSTQHAPGP